MRPETVTGRLNDELSLVLIDSQGESWRSACKEQAPSGARRIGALCALCRRSQSPDSGSMTQQSQPDSSLVHVRHMLDAPAVAIRVFRGGQRRIIRFESMEALLRASSSI